MFRYTVIIGATLLVTALIALAATSNASASATPDPVPDVSTPSRTDQRPTGNSPGPASPKAPASPATATLIDPFDGIELRRMRRTPRGYVQTFDDKTVFFTVDPTLQQYADDLFDRYEVPAGAAVMINSRTGRVVTLSQQRRTREAADIPDVALDPSPPAASLFKIITTAALIEKGGVPLSHETCYAGGSHRLVMQHLLDPLPKNHACVNLATALGSSINAVFAKLSDRYLNRTLLREYAERFGFNHPVDFDVPLRASSAEIPADRLERARAAAGFWHSHLSPLHAAVIAQSLAQDGAMLRPYVVDRVAGAGGETLYRAKPRYLGQTVSRETAALMTKAMIYTTRRGTARKSFRDPQGRPYVPEVDVSGKTGTLTGQRPYRAYTWFVGLAPAEEPEVAIAVLVVNEPKWRIKAPQMAALLLKEYFQAKR